MHAGVLGRRSELQRYRIQKHFPPSLRGMYAPPSLYLLPCEACVVVSPVPPPYRLGSGAAFCSFPKPRRPFRDGVDIRRQRNKLPNWGPRPPVESAFLLLGCALTRAVAAGLDMDVPLHVTLVVFHGRVPCLSWIAPPMLTPEPGARQVLIHRTSRPTTFGFSLSCAPLCH